MKTALAISLLGVLFGLPFIFLVTSGRYAVRHWSD